MKQFYLVKNDDGVRFIPSLGLHYSIPCEILGELSIDDDFDFSCYDLRNLNNSIRSTGNRSDSSANDFSHFGIAPQPK